MNNSKQKAEALIKVYDNLSWEDYVDLVDNVVHINRGGSFDDQLAGQAQEYGYYNGLLTVAKKRVTKLEKELATLEATSGKRRRTELASSGKKITDKSIELWIAALPEVSEMKDRIIEQEHKHSLLRSLVMSLKDRKDCLIQLSSNRRAEMNING